MCLMAENDIDDCIDIGNVNLSITIDIGTLSGLVIDIAPKNDVNDGVDIGNIDLAIVIDVARQVCTLNNCHSTGRHEITINGCYNDNTSAIPNRNDGAIRYDTNLLTGTCPSNLFIRCIFRKNRSNKLQRLPYLMKFTSFVIKRYTRHWLYNCDLARIGCKWVIL